MSIDVEAIYSQAAELGPSEQEAFLDRACDGDPELREKLKSLLAASANLRTTLFHRITGLSALVATSIETLPIDVDRYTLHKRIGEGAFGVVYRATQNSPVRRSVAIKVLRPGLDSEQVVKRFESERQALAALDHTNIARFFDAGHTQDGRPYFVMELLEGVPLNTYCTENALDLRSRMNLFLQVCDGVEHAHRRGILHRDLKPPNVIVVHDERSPQVKVIDFGIARALGSEIPFGTLATEVGRLMGTPEYMSPEQIDGEPQDVDTRSDVYALGAMLYEMLCGKLPFDSQMLRASRLSELRRVVCDVDPPPPSLAWKGDEAGLAEAAAQRQTNAAGLIRELAREIEWVPMCALRKTPADRYRGVAELADDIRNHLAGRPLAAGPDTLAYRARKFVQRNRSAVIAGSIIIALLIAAVVGTSIGMFRARRAQAGANAQRDLTELQLADTLMTRGQYATDQSHFVDAWDSITQARAILVHHKRATLPADIGLYGVLSNADPPEAILQSSHLGTVWISYADDGKTLYSATPFVTIEWDIATRRRVREIPYQLVAISPDERTLFGIDATQAVFALNRQSLEIITKFEVDARDGYGRFALSKDGKWLAGCHVSGTVPVWDTTTGRLLAKLTLGNQVLEAAAFSPEASELAVASAERGVEVFETAQWTKKKSLKTSEGYTDLVYLPDGKAIAASSWERRSVLIDAQTGQIIRAFPKTELEASRLRLFPDATRVLVTSADASVTVIDVATGAVNRRQLGHRKPAIGAAIAPDGRHFATASSDGEIRLWNLNSRRVDFLLPREDAQRIYEIPASSDDRYIIYHGRPSEVWDTQSRTKVCDLDTNGQTLCLGTHFTADGTRIRGMIFKTSAPVAEWDAKTGKQLRQLVAHGARPRSYVATEDARRIITFGDGTGVKMWDGVQNKLLWEHPPTDRLWRDYALSDDGKYVASTAVDGRLDILNGDTGELLRKIPTVAATRGFARVYFVPGASHLLIWSHEADNRARLVNVVTGEQLWIAGDQAMQKSGWGLSADRTMLMFGNGERVWDFHSMADGKFIFRCTLPKAFESVTPSPLGTRLYYLTKDFHLGIADLTIGTKLAESDQLIPSEGLTQSKP